MPEKIVRQVVKALKDHFRGPDIEIPIALREEPAVTIFPGLVEEEPQPKMATALGSPDVPFSLPSPNMGIDALLGASDPLSGGPQEDLFAPEIPDELSL